MLVTCGVRQARADDNQMAATTHWQQAGECQHMMVTVYRVPAMPVVEGRPNTHIGKLRQATSTCWQKTAGRWDMTVTDGRLLAHAGDGQLATSMHQR